MATLTLGTCLEAPREGNAGLTKAWRPMDKELHSFQGSGLGLPLGSRGSLLLVE